MYLCMKENYGINGIFFNYCQEQNSSIFGWLFHEHIFHFWTIQSLYFSKNWFIFIIIVKMHLKGHSQDSGLFSSGSDTFKNTSFPHGTEHLH